MGWSDLSKPLLHIRMPGQPTGRPPDGDFLTSHHADASAFEPSPLHQTHTSLSASHAVKMASSSESSSGSRTVIPGVT